MTEDLPPLYDFIEDVKQIFPDGDLVSAYNTLKEHLEMFKKLDRTPLTYDYVMTKFASLHKQWNHKYGLREMRFISKEAMSEQKTFDEFLNRQMYWQEFVIASAPGSSERDSYLFGSFEKKYLKEQIDLFDKSLRND